MDDKTEFVKQEIEKSGFPFEMEIAFVLKEDKWQVLPSAPYWSSCQMLWKLPFSIGVSQVGMPTS